MPLRWVPVLVACVVTACGAGDDGASRAPDVVLVVIDTLRPDHLELAGYPHATAPFLQRLARDGVTFRQARSTSSWTAPATASLFTGLYPLHHGVTHGMHARGAPGEDGAAQRLELTPLPTDRATLPELFQQAGYQTFGVASNVNIGDTLGFDRGFDRFELHHRATAPELAQVLRPWLSLRDDPRPRFVYLHLNDVHVPYNRRDPWYRDPALEGREVRSSQHDAVERYDSEIGFLDDTLAALEQTLVRREDTVFAVLSDHGEEFQDHGQWGHQFSLYDELNRVLFLVRAPGVTEAGRVVDVPVSLIDVRPTLCELAGLERDPQDGQSLVPLLAADSAARLEEPLQRRILFAHRQESGREKWAAMLESWKLIETHIDGQSSVELFQLSRDPAETEDVSERHPEVLSRLQEELDRFRQGARVGAAPVRVAVDAELWRHLQELGYTGGER